MAFVLTAATSQSQRHRQHSLLVKSSKPKGSCLNPVRSCKNRLAAHVRENNAFALLRFATQEFLGCFIDSHSRLQLYYQIWKKKGKNSSLQDSVRYGRAGCVLKGKHVLLTGGPRDTWDGSCSGKMITRRRGGRGGVQTIFGGHSCL